MEKNIEEFHEFYKKYAKKIFILFYYLLDIKEDAYELTEQTFMRAYRKFFRKKNVKKDFKWLKINALYVAHFNGYKEKLRNAADNLDKKIEALDDTDNDDKPEK